MTTDLLRIQTEESGSAARMALIGELDVSTTMQLMEEFVRLTTRSMALIEVDLSQLSYTDSSGLSVFVTAHMQCHDSGISLRFVDPNLFMMNLFVLTKLDRVLDVAASEVPVPA